MANGAADISLKMGDPAQLKPITAHNNGVRIFRQVEEESRLVNGNSDSYDTVHHLGCASRESQNMVESKGSAVPYKGSKARKRCAKMSGTSSVDRRVKGKSRAAITSSTFNSPTNVTVEYSGTNSAKKLPSVSGLSRSCENLSLLKNTDSNHSIKPLIHHQRHNLKSRFQLLSTLGEGTYGKVKLAVDKSSGENVAIKYIKKTKIHEDADLARIRREIQILSNLRHRHVVNIREVFEKKDKIVLVMDYAQGGELYDYLNRIGCLSESEARRIFRQIVSAIYCCHKNGIVHRDLKLENIILDDEGNVKIADFGLANYYSESTLLNTFCGSPLYASPEIVNGRPYYGPEVDVWSLGVLLYTLVYGTMPFESSSLVSLKQQISTGDYKKPARLSDAAGLIRHMLTVTPVRRASMDNVLHHWWINMGHPIMPDGQLYNPFQDDEMERTNINGLNLHKTLENSAQSLPSRFALSTANTNCIRTQSEDRKSHFLSDDKNAPEVSVHHENCELPNHIRPVIVHQRNQSSLSSDSDGEPDYIRSPQWAQPQHSKALQPCINSKNNPAFSDRPQQHKDNSLAMGTHDMEAKQRKVSPCATESELHISNSCKPSQSIPTLKASTVQTSTTLKSNLNSYDTRDNRTAHKLHLPPSVMHIFAGCSDKSLAALLTPDPDGDIMPFNPFGFVEDKQVDVVDAPRNISSAHDTGHLLDDGPDITHENNLTRESHLSGSSAASVLPAMSAIDTAVFDSQRKPKRGILKRRGKFSGAPGDTNSRDCDKEDKQALKTRGGHLPRRLPSFRDETSGNFATRHQSNQLSGIALCSQNLSIRQGNLLNEEDLHSLHLSLCEGQKCPSGVQERHILENPIHSSLSSVISQQSNDLNYSINCTFSEPEPVNKSSIISDATPPTKTMLNSLSLVTTESYVQCHGTVINETCSHTKLLSVDETLTCNDVKNSSFSRNTHYDLSASSILCQSDKSTNSYFEPKAFLPDVMANDLDNEQSHKLSCATKLALEREDKMLITTTSENDVNLPSSIYTTAATWAQTKLTTVPFSCLNPKPMISNNQVNPSNSSSDSAYESSSFSSSFSAIQLLSFAENRTKGGHGLAKEQAHNRLSMCSIGSNSSAEILDLSYDSGDNEHFFNLKQEAPGPDSSLHSNYDPTATEHMCGEDQNAPNITPLACDVEQIHLGYWKLRNNGTSSLKINEGKIQHLSDSFTTENFVTFRDVMDEKNLHTMGLNTRQSTQIPQEGDKIAKPEKGDSNLRGASCNSIGLSKSEDSSSQKQSIDYHLKSSLKYSEEVRLGEGSGLPQMASLKPSIYDTPSSMVGASGETSISCAIDGRSIKYNRMLSENTCRQSSSSSIQLTPTEIRSTPTLTKDCLDSHSMINEAESQSLPEEACRPKHQNFSEMEKHESCVQTDQMLTSTESGSPLIYRLTREAHTWI